MKKQVLRTAKQAQKQMRKAGIGKKSAAEATGIFLAGAISMEYYISSGVLGHLTGTPGKKHK